MTVNPWLAEKVDVLRKKHTEEYLRADYENFNRPARENPERWKGWKDYLLYRALDEALLEDPFLETPLACLDLPEAVSKGLYWSGVDCLADIIQMTGEELLAVATDKKFDAGSVLAFLSGKGYRLFHGTRRTLKLSEFRGRWMIPFPGGSIAFSYARPALYPEWLDELYSRVEHVDREERLSGDLRCVKPYTDFIPEDYLDFFREIGEFFRLYDLLCREQGLQRRIQKPEYPETLEELRSFTNDRFLFLRKEALRALIDIFQRTRLFKHATVEDFLSARITEHRLSIAERQCNYKTFLDFLSSYLVITVDFECVLEFLERFSNKSLMQKRKRPDPVNPWLAEAVEAYRNSHSEAQLREQYEAYGKAHPGRGWEDYLTAAALVSRTREDGFLLTRREAFGLPKEQTDFLETLCIDILADLLQFTAEELTEMAQQEKADTGPVLRFLEAHGYQLRSCSTYTYKISLPADDEGS